MRSGFLVIESITALGVLICVSWCMMQLFVQCHRYEQKALARTEALLLARSLLIEYCLHRQSPGRPPVLISLSAPKKYHTTYSTKSLTSDCTQVAIEVTWHQCGEQERIGLSTAFLSKEPL